MAKHVTLAAGGGGEESLELIEGLFFKHFANDILLEAEDAALLELSGKTAFTVDSYTVNPLEFAGGNIGTLAVTGTLNDLAMRGAKALYLSAAFMIEEGLEFELLERIVISMAEVLKEHSVKIVCGDTKVVPKGTVDQLFITTSGIGEVFYEGLSSHRLEEGDLIVLSNSIGRHGAAIFAAREGIESDISSDCEVLYPCVRDLCASGLEVISMRDATRGGVSALLNEWAKASNVEIEVEEKQIQIDANVQGICEIFGFNALDFANEGTFIAALREEDVANVTSRLKSVNSTHSLYIIGRVVTKGINRVLLKSAWGTKRTLPLPKGELLPRIC